MKRISFNDRVGVGSIWSYIQLGPMRKNSIISFMGIKLVIVDDAPFIREVVLGVIAGSEIECIGEAADGEAAVRIVLERKPDVVLMDLVLPVKSGIEAVEEILSVASGVRIVACSTMNQEAMVLKALSVGCCDYISKPFEAKRLLQVIRGCAGKRPAQK